MVTASVDTVVCTNAVPFVWNGINITGAGSYDYTTTASSGCDSTTTLNVTLSSANLIVSNPSAVCSPNTVDLTAASVTAGSDPNLVYTYWKDAGATAPLTNSNSISASGVYYIQATAAGGCSTIKPVNVIINTVATPNLVITNPAEVCSPATIDLTNAAITAGSDQGLSYTYWADAASTIPVPDPKAVSESGIYYITATSAGGCASAASGQVVVNVNTPVAGIRYPNVAATSNTPVQLSARDLGINDTYTWQPPVGLNFYDVQKPTFNYNQQTEYTIAITPPNGKCPTIDTVLVVISDNIPILQSSLVVPTAWSPNGDGHNDKLYPLTINIKEFRYFRVYNRWGQLMFETNTIGQGWDGTFNGVPQVMDVYTWIVDATGVDGVRYKLSGNSILMR